jgi:hypothetical protein
MNWTFVRDVMEWELQSKLHDQGYHFCWRITVTDEGLFDVNDSADELCKNVELFDTLKSAKAFCEYGERSI